MDGPIDLNDLNAPARVLPAQYSKTEALVGVGQKKPRRISVPENTTLTLHLVTIDYLHSITFKKLAEATRERISTQILLFFKFIKKNKYITDSDVPNNVFEAFIQYINENTKTKGNSVSQIANIAKYAIDWYLRSGEAANQGYDANVLRLYVAHFPKFQKGDTKAYPSLATMFPKCPYSDIQIIKSLRLVCCWVLLEYNRQRDILLCYDEVSALTKEVKSKDISTPPVSHAVFRHNNKQSEIRSESVRLYAPIVQAVLKSEDPVLMERLMQSVKHPFKYVMSLKEMQICLGKLFKTDAKRPTFNYEKKSYQQASIQTLTYRDLLAPSLVEVFTAQCFYAADRVQASNSERLKLTDVATNDRGMQTEHGKGRRPKRNQKSITDVYKPDELVHDALSVYFHITNDSQPLLPSEDQGFAFPYLQSRNLKHGFLGSSNNAVTTLFSLLTTEGTHTQKSLYKDITSDEAQPFLWVVTRIIQNNRVVEKQASEYSKLLHSGAKVSRGSVVTAQTTSLNPTFIGQSRVAMDSGNTVREKGTGETPDSSNSRVEAQLTNQSEATKHNTYYDKSNSKEVIESGRTFTTQLGTLMLKDAKKMGQLIKDTQVVDFKQAQKMLGCESASEDFVSFIGELGVDIGTTSEIKKGDKTIFVAHDLTAALILLKVSHIENQMPNLLIDDPESQNKALEAASEKIYLQEVLKRFPQNIQANGKAMSHTLDFSFADLI
jgi:hypothetical protein